MTKPVINRKWRTDYVPQIGDIVKFQMFGCRDKVGVVLGIEKQEKDYTTHNFIQWYVSEQLEEEALARTIQDKLKLIGGDKGGLYLFDRDLENASIDFSGGSSDEGQN